MAQENVLDYLKARFDRVDQTLDEMRTDIREVKSRIGRLERMQADGQVQLAEHSTRMDRVLDRVEVLGRRFEAVEGMA